MKKILKITHPPIVGYPDYAYPLSIVLNEVDNNAWLFCNFIQLYYTTGDEDNSINYYYTDTNNRMWDARNPLLDYQTIHKDTLKTFNINIIDFFIKLIDMGYYCYTYFDEYYLIFSPAYKQVHFTHVSFIYGYDLENKKFYLAGYDKSYKYSYNEVDFDMIKEAYDLCERDYYDDKNTIYLMIYSNKSSKYEFNINVVLEQLNEYLYSINTSERYNLCFNPRPNLVFGIKAVEELINKIDRLIDNQEMRFSIKPFYILVEHKKLMNLRINYLIEQGYLNPECSSKKMFIELEHEYLLVQNMAVKYYLSNTTDILRRMKGLLVNSIQLEIEGLSELINEVNSTLVGGNNVDKL